MAELAQADVVAVRPAEPPRRQTMLCEQLYAGHGPQHFHGRTTTVQPQTRGDFDDAERLVRVVKPPGPPRSQAAALQPRRESAFPRFEVLHAATMRRRKKQLVLDTRQRRHPAFESPGHDGEITHRHVRREPPDVLRRPLRTLSAAGPLPPGTSRHPARRKVHVQC